MTGTIAHVAAAGLFLLITHFGISSTPLRGALVARIGEKPYLGLYSLISALAFWWLVAAYNDAPYEPLWPAAGWQAWVPLLVVPVTLVLLVAGFSTPNPTAVGQEKLLTGAEEPARGILRVTRNPFLWGVGLWALAHLVPNGDLAALVLFGSLAVLALLGSLLIDAKMARRLGPAWDRFAARTSNIPFAAIAAGRQSFVWREIGWWRGAVALVLYVGFLHLHRLVFGVSPFPV
ncbi:NnrU family protein [Azospirillum sp. sgz302134]